ncbi:protein kinase domain-containing protein [Aeromonas jandaei]|uniref:protein kinase domain-containing protein n=1 Tax=Aeromonas jandaei TaxID=650 RepID=UPI003BA319E0
MQQNSLISIKDINNEQTLCINKQPIISHEILDTLGSGANGIVYLARNKILDRKEAIKIWIRTKKKDNRDKVIQGIHEARKLAAANNEHSVEIYSAQIFEGVPFVTMEYVKGNTLREYIKTSDDKTKIKMAYLYLEAIEGTTRKNLVHGDPHLSNVLVYRYNPDMFSDEIKIKLCDFGTSIFSGRESSSVRHWRIVEESIIEITKNMKDFNYAQSCLPEFKNNLASIDMSSGLDIFTDKQIAQIKNSPLRDYLRCFTSTHNGNTIYHP